MSSVKKVERPEPVVEPKEAAVAETTVKNAAPTPAPEAGPKPVRKPRGATWVVPTQAFQRVSGEGDERQVVAHVRGGPAFTCPDEEVLHLVEEAQLVRLATDDEIRLAQEALAATPDQE